MSDPIYRDEFMDIYKAASNFGELVDADVSVKEVNRFCGDTINLQLKVVGDIVTDTKYTGSSCAVSKVSASLLTDYVKGKKVEQLLELTEKDIFDIIGFDFTGNRRQCALVCFNALKKALGGYNKSK